jgi:hypothetical protein
LAGAVPLPARAAACPVLEVHGCFIQGVPDHGLLGCFHTRRTGPWAAGVFPYKAYRTMGCWGVSTQGVPDHGLLGCFHTRRTGPWAAGVFPYKAYRTMGCWGVSTQGVPDHGLLGCFHTRRTGLNAFPRHFVHGLGCVPCAVHGPVMDISEGSQSLLESEPGPGCLPPTNALCRSTGVGPVDRSGAMKRRADVSRERKEGGGMPHPSMQYRAVRGAESCVLSLPLSLCVCVCVCTADARARKLPSAVLASRL